jgi:hypothetical protein
VTREHDARAARGVTVFDFNDFGRNENDLLLMAARQTELQRDAEEQHLEAGERQHRPKTLRGELRPATPNEATQQLAKNQRAPATLSERFGASSMRVADGGMTTPVVGRSILPSAEIRADSAA